MVTVHERLIHWLEERGDLDRALEFLPTDAEIEKRAHDGLGLKSPEFSVLVAYAKLALKEDILASSIPDDPYFERTLADVLPAADPGAVRRRARAATRCAARSSPTRWSTRWSTAAASPSPSGRRRRPAPPPSRSPARSSSAARCSGWPTTCARSRRSTTWCRPRRRPRSTSSSAGCSTARCAGSSPPGPRRLDIGAEIERFSGVVRELRHRRCPSLLRGEERKRRLDRKAAELVKAGVPDELAVRAAIAARLVLAARHRRHRHRHRPRPERRRAAVLPGLRAVRHRRDAQQGHRACRATTGGTPWPAARCATTCTPCSSR